MGDHILEMDSRHRYWCVNPEHKGQPCDGVIFRSVTTILNKAVPKDLSWHGQTRGVIGVKGLLRIPKYNVRAMKPSEIVSASRDEGFIESGHAASPAHRVKLSAVPKYNIAKMRPDEITDALKRERLTVNDHRDEAAVGGTAVHKALEDYINRGTIPSVMDVPEAKRASMRGLARFIMEYRPEFVASEVRVLSIEHAFAGTFDFLARIRMRIALERVGRTERVILAPDPTVEPMFVLGDMKNSKWVYPTSHFPQLEAYEGARLEAGDTPTDVRAVLWVNGDGDMEFVPSTSSFADFLALKASAEVIQRLDKSWKRPRKAKA